MDAPRGSVEREEAKELECLRRRAYGPDADIAGDAAAQARLSELEAAQRRQLTPVVDAAAGLRAGLGTRPPEPVPPPEPVEGPRSASTSVPQPVDGEFAEHGPAGGSVTGQHPTEGPIADSGSIDGARAAPWWRRRRWLAILGGAIAALALIAANVAGMSQLLADESAPIPTEASTAKMPRVPAGVGRGYFVPAPDFVLALESGSVEPNDRHGVLEALGVSTDELRQYEDFRGRNVGILNVWSGESRYGMTCLFVAVPVQGLREGYGAEGCSPHGLDTVADLPEMGGDTVIRFVLRADHVDVYVYERAADPSTSEG